MGLWRSILRWFGLQREARVQITAPGIEVTLAGEPTQVRALMGVIRNELERKARRDRRLNKVNESQVVRPTELDEMDSPYALPEAMVLPVPDEERPAADQVAGGRARIVAMATPEWSPKMSVADTLTGQEAFGAEDVESVRTALTPHPAEGPTPPVVQGVRAAGSEIDTLEVDRRLRRVTRPLVPAKSESDSDSA